MRTPRQYDGVMRTIMRPLEDADVEAILQRARELEKTGDPAAVSIGRMAQRAVKLLRSLEDGDGDKNRMGGRGVEPGYGLQQGEPGM